MGKYKLDMLFVKRFYLCLKLILPTLTSTSSLLFVMLLGFSLAQQLVIYNVGLLPSQFFTVLGAKDDKEFKPLIFLSLGLIIGVSLSNAIVKLISGILYVVWRNLLTKYIHTRYFYNNTMYQINTFYHDIDNADQRITQDVDRFCLTLSDMSAKLIISPLTIIYYSYQCFTNAGYLGPLSIYAYFIVGTIINRLVMAPIVGIVVQQEQREGNFRFKHMNLRVNAEAIALMRSQQVEKTKTNEALKELLSTQFKIAKYEYWLNLAVNLFDYLGSILSYVIIAIPIFAGYYDKINSVALSSLISRNAFVSMYLISCFSTLMDLSGKITDLAGYSHRVGELLLAMTEVNESCSRKTDEFNKASQNYNRDTTFPAFELTDIDYTPPKGGAKLVEALNLTITKDKRVLITGKTGSGKSSLLRILCNLWQPQRGKVLCHLPIEPEGIFFLPQQPFLTNGTLVDNVTYPLQFTGLSLVEEEKLKKKVEICMDDVGLSTLVSRIGGVDITMDWNSYKALSPGETQRLCFARVFFHKPKFAVLDEPTSALGVAEEDCFYTHCANLGITAITVGHRSSLRQYHDTLLHLDGEGGWKVTELSEDNK